MSGRPRLIALCAVGWATLFALAHFYWGAGGCVGFDLSECEVGFRNPYFVAFNLISGFLCVLGAIFVLGLVFTERASGTLSVLVLIGGVLLTLRGAVGLVQDVFIVTREGLRLTMIYDPWFLIGGILFLSVWKENRNSRRRKT